MTKAIELLDSIIAGVNRLQNAAIDLELYKNDLKEIDNMIWGTIDMIEGEDNYV